LADDISRGFAQIIDASALAVFHEDAVYEDSETGIVMKAVPPSPDRVVTITVVPRSDDIAAPQGEVMVQLRFRGLPNQPLDVDALADAVKPLFHGLSKVPMGDHVLVQCDRRQSVPLGQDAFKRWERADQFYLDVEFPSSDLVPEGGTY
jgi:hypothetical protein